MTDRPRCVIDTNVLISALLKPDGTPSRAVEVVLRRGTLLQSLATIEELVSRIHRRRFDRYLAAGRRAAFLLLLRQAWVLVTLTEEVEASRDPDDDKFLALAVAGRSVA